MEIVIFMTSNNIFLVTSNNIFLVDSNQLAYHAYWIHTFNLLSFISIEIQVTRTKLQFNTNLDFFFFLVFKLLGTEFSLMSLINHLVDGKE